MIFFRQLPLKFLSVFRYELAHLGHVVSPAGAMSAAQ